jgi:hypothetical protein
MNLSKIQNKERCIPEKENKFSFAEAPQRSQIAESIEIKKSSIRLAYFGI